MEKTFKIKKDAEYLCEVTDLDFKNNASFLLTDFGHKLRIPFLYEVGRSVKLLATSIKRTQIRFSQRISDNGLYNLDDHYHLQFISETQHKGKLVLICSDNLGNEFFVNVNNTLKNSYKLGSNVYCKPISIFGNTVRFFEAPNAEDEYLEKDQVYEFNIINIEKVVNYEKESFKIWFEDSKGNTKTVLGRLWQFQERELITKIKCKYLGQNTFKQVYEKTIHPSLIIGKKYKLKINTIQYDKEGREYYEGTFNSNSVWLYIPFTINNPNDVLDCYLDYHFTGVTGSGDLGFKFFVTFEDIISSKSLKILVFDYLRNEFNNETEGYQKLFSDYDNLQNIWVMSFCSQLTSIAFNKLYKEEFEFAYLFLEVHEILESWILDSGFLTSLKGRKREATRQFATSEIRRSKLLRKTLDIIIEDKVEDELKNFYSQFQINKHLINNDDIFIIGHLYRFAPNLKDNIGQIIEFCFSIGTLDCDGKIEILNILSSKLNYIKRELEKELDCVFVSAKNRTDFYINNFSLWKLINIEILLFLIERKEHYFNEKLAIIRILRLYIYYYGADETLIKRIIYMSLYPSNWNEKALDVLCFNYCEDFLKKCLTLTNSIDIAKITLGVKLDFDEDIDLDFFSTRTDGFIFRQSNIKADFVLPFNNTNLKYVIGDKIKGNINLSDNRTNNYIIKIKQKDLPKDFVLKEGDICNGIIKSSESYGYFVYLENGQEGLIYNSNISPLYVQQINRFLKKGEKVQVKVLSIIDNKISLDRAGLLKENAKCSILKVGDIVNARVANSTNNYAYLELEDGSIGSINRNECCWNGLGSILNYYSIGELVVVKIINIDKKFGFELSELALSEPPKYMDLINKPTEGIILTIGKTNDVKSNFIYLKLPEYKLSGIIRNISEDLISKFEVGNKVDLVILEVDIDKQIILEFANDNLQFNENLENFSLIENEFIFTELGFLYEQLAFSSHSEIDTINHLEFSKFYHSLARSPRSYYLSLFLKYVHLISEVRQGKNSNFIKAEANKLCLEIEENEISQKIFPILNKLFLKSKIISKINDQDLYAINQINTSLDSNEKELLDLSNLVMAHNAMFIYENIKKEIWELIREQLINSFKIIEEDDFSEEIKNLRYEIREYIENGIEDRKLEFKSSFFTPTYNREQIGKRKELLNLIKKAKENDDTIKEDKYNYELNIFETKSKTHFTNKESQKAIILSVLKTINAFLNSDGGTLLVGIGEDENKRPFIHGLKNDLDFIGGIDNLLLKFDDLISNHLGTETMELIRVNVVPYYEGEHILVIKVKPSKLPQYLTWEKEPKFYIRRNASSSELRIDQIFKYCSDRFSLNLA